MLNLLARFSSKHLSFQPAAPTALYPIGNIFKKFNHDYVRKAMPELEEVEAQKKEKCSKWLSYNDHIFPPQGPDEPRRPAYVCHVKRNLKYSPKKMWYVACLVRGLSIEEAIKQLGFVTKKGALLAKETLLEAQNLALQQHNVEFKTNLWVAESFVGKGFVVKGMRRHARMRVGRVEYKYCHYFVRLEEGTPPENYYRIPPSDRDYFLSKYMEEIRQRHIRYSL